MSLHPVIRILTSSSGAAVSTKVGEVHPQPILQEPQSKQSHRQQMMSIEEH